MSFKIRRVQGKVSRITGPVNNKKSCYLNSSNCSKYPLLLEIYITIFLLKKICLCESIVNNKITASRSDVGQNTISTLQRNMLLNRQICLHFVIKCRVIDIRLAVKKTVRFAFTNIDKWIEERGRKNTYHHEIYKLKLCMLI